MVLGKRGEVLEHLLGVAWYEADGEVGELIDGQGWLWS